MGELGNETLLGPKASEVEIKRVVKHQKRDTDLIEFTTEGAPSPFKITADHTILIQRESGEQEFAPAKELTDSLTESIRISDGERFWMVTGANLMTESVSVVEVTFKDAKATVLAWMLPKSRRHNGPRELWERAAVACRGSLPAASDSP